MKKSKLPSSLILLAGCLLIAGCNPPKGCRHDRSSGLTFSELSPPTLGEASIAGTVRFEGQAPEMKPIPEAAGCGAAGGVQEEWAVVAPDGALANVLVFIEDAEPSSGEGREAVVLDQVDCRFVPRVIGVQIGQPLQARSSDAELHNVHYNPARNANTNFGLKMNEERTVSFRFPEPRPVEVKCDVHPWMTAWIGVFAHPFYAVTDESGRFQIHGVPAGEYTLKAWHERFGTRQETITVADAGEVTQDFTFARRGG